LNHDNGRSVLETWVKWAQVSDTLQHSQSESAIPKNASGSDRNNVKFLIFSFTNS
jgi:hypothetical protein